LFGDGKTPFRVCNKVKQIIQFNFRKKVRAVLELSPKIIASSRVKRILNGGRIKKLILKYGS
jgi:hypothetical protein